MPLVGLSEVAADLAVTPRRVRQLVETGVLPAVRVGGRWLVDEADVEAARGRSGVRPLSARSTWAMVMASLLEAGAAAGSTSAAGASVRGDAGAGSVLLDEGWGSWWRGLDDVERSRARKRWRATVSAAVAGDADVAALLRASMRRRAYRLSLTAAAVDLPALAVDARLTLAGVSLPGSGISAGGLLEAYVAEQDLPGVRQEFLLRSQERGAPTEGRALVVLHVISRSTPGRVPTAAPLVLACDLVQWRSPREDARALEVLQTSITTAAGAP